MSVLENSIPEPCDRYLCSWLARPRHLGSTAVSPPGSLETEAPPRDTRDSHAAGVTPGTLSPGDAVGNNTATMVQTRCSL